VKRAAIEAREKIFDVISRAYYFNKDSLYLEDGKVKCYTNLI